MLQSFGICICNQYIDLAYIIGTTDVLFLVRRMQEECRKNCICFCVDLEKLYMFCVDIKQGIRSSFKKGDGVGNEKERLTRINCKSSVESLPQNKEKS